MAKRAPRWVDRDFCHRQTCQQLVPLDFLSSIHSPDIDRAMVFWRSRTASPFSSPSERHGCDPRYCWPLRLASLPVT